LTDAAGGGGVIDTGGAADWAGALGDSPTAGLSLVATSPSRRIFEFALGSDNRFSSTRLGNANPNGA
jgi:hypothetical protein